MVMMRFFHFCLVLMSLPLQAADWPQFLGPTRDGVASAEEAALPEKLPLADPLWAHAVGEGHAGPVVVGGKVIIFHRQQDQAVAECLEAKTGTVLWQQRWPTSYKDSFGMDQGPRAVPSVADGRIYLHGADGWLRALELESGKLLWELDTEKEYASPQGFFGRASAPLIAGGKVILCTGGKQAVMALDAVTGKPVWTAGDDEASYASPVLVGSDLLLCWLRNHLTTIRLKDGKEVQRAYYRPKIEASVNAATPVLTASGWFLSAEYDLGSSVWSMDPSGALKTEWMETELLNCHYATPVAHQNWVFGFHGRQERGMTLRCIDVAQKKLCWESDKLPGGTLLRVKDKLLILTEAGELWLARATAEKFDLLDSMQILRAGHRSYAAYANGIYFARDAAKLMAFRLNP
jgi:outer membrane protein assembly factor BamB